MRAALGSAIGPAYEVVGQRAPLRKHIGRAAAVSETLIALFERMAGQCANLVALAVRRGDKD